MQKLPLKYTRNALLKLPVRKWDEETIYDYVLLVPTRQKHDSGYGLIAIVGVRYLNKEQWGEIAAYCDDVCWTFPMHHPYDRNGKHNNPLRTDCCYPSGIMRMWASSEHYFVGRFQVGTSLSSTDVELILEPRGDATKLKNALRRCRL